MTKKSLIMLLFVVVLCSAQYMKFATAVLPDTIHVDYPYYALGAPDEQYADVRYYGNLDLEIEVNNGYGDDLVIYAKRPAVGILPETMNCAVFVNSRDDEWQFLGLLTGINYNARYDLGEIRSAQKVRILFKQSWDLEQAKPLKVYPMDYSIGIDSVVALH